MSDLPSKYSTASVAFDLFKEMSEKHMQPEKDKIWQLSSQERMRYYLQLYHACLMTVGGMKPDGIQIPEIK